jgi:RNA polymerase sigma factor (sigma-70 family)
MAIDDREWLRLWRGILAGRPEQADAFARAALRIVLPVYRSRVPNEEDLKDLLQSYMEKLLRDEFRVLRQYEPSRAPLKTFLKTVAVRHWLDWLKSASNRRRAQEVDLVSIAEPPSRLRADDGLKVERLAAGIEQIPRPKDRVCMLLHVAGLKDAEIAMSLGMPLGSVATCLARARTFLRGQACLDVGE